MGGEAAQRAAHAACRQSDQQQTDCPNSHGNGTEVEQPPLQTAKCIGGALILQQRQRLRAAERQVAGADQIRFAIVVVEGQCALEAGGNLLSVLRQRQRAAGLGDQLAAAIDQRTLAVGRAGVEPWLGNELRGCHQGDDDADRLAIELLRRGGLEAPDLARNQNETAIVQFQLVHELAGAGAAGG